MSNKRKRPSNESDGEEETHGGGKESTARNETERRMYEAVRKAGRAVRSGGVMGEFNSGGSEFQVFAGGELERMVGKK
jgi:ATP-dependent RNA helicase DDX31/DBP7